MHPELHLLTIFYRRPLLDLPLVDEGHDLHPPPSRLPPVHPTPPAATSILAIEVADHIVGTIRPQTTIDDGDEVRTDQEMSFQSGEHTMLSTAYCTLPVASKVYKLVYSNRCSPDKGRLDVA